MRIMCLVLLVAISACSKPASLTAPSASLGAASSSAAQRNGMGGPGVDDCGVLCGDNQEATPMAVQIP